MSESFPNGKHKFTPAEAKKGVQSSIYTRKSMVKLSKQIAKMGFTESMTQSLSGIIVEFLRTANSNPLMGIVTAVVTVDVLYRLKLITSTAYVAILGIVGFEVAVDEAGNIISAIAQLDKLFGSNSQSNPITPSATTIVYGAPNGAGQGAPDLQALLSVLNRLPKA